MGGGGLNSRVGWKLPGYLIGGGRVLTNRNGKSKNYVFILNVKKRI